MSEVLVLIRFKHKVRNTIIYRLGDKNANFVSGSNNNLEISSSMFHLDPRNDVMKMSGSITVYRA